LAVREDEALRLRLNHRRLERSYEALVAWAREA
jgi:hypothetical protein